MRRVVVLIVFIIALSAPLSAWNATGHMIVGYIAYQRLDPSVRARVNTLLKRHPDYSKWAAAAPAGQEGLVAFINAAFWPDCIKGSACPGYFSDGPNDGNSPPAGSSATQNIGYRDHAMHKYWHFIDIPYAPGGLPTKPPPKVNAETQIVYLRAMLQSKVDEDIKSYDLVWIEHLVGDIHQPLHDTSRFTTLHPHGDIGGNLVRFCDAPCDQPDNLHAYWDRLMGSQTDFATIQKLASELLAQPEPADTTNIDVGSWIRRNAELAERFAYAAPISTESTRQSKLSPRPDAAYDAQAHKIARQQVLLAGYRLAYLLNQNLK